MPGQLSVLHASTPTITVNSITGSVRTLRFLRESGQNNEPARLLTTRTTTAPLTRTARAFGARRLVNAATGDADAVTLTALAGQPLMLHTADGDITLALGDAAGRTLWTQNAQGTVSMVTCEPETEAGRPLAATEQPAGDKSRIRGQYAYAPFSDGQWKTKNLAGSMTEHRNNAGINRPLSMSVTGQLLLSEERLLKPETGLPDWTTTTEDETEEALKESATYDATGAPLSATNAVGVSTLTAYDISGVLTETRLRYTERGAAKEVIALSALLRNAEGTVLSETAGNGVTQMYYYNPQTRYLTRHTVRRDALTLSDLQYTHDPAGNILILDEVATGTQWHRNQVTDGQRAYTYDTLYRQTSATGRERLADTTRGSQTRLKSDGTWFPYSENYTYDDGDNLTGIAHVGKESWTRKLTVSVASNRALQSDHALRPEEGFLGGGLQKQLTDGRRLEWYADGQLYQVSPVARAGEASDTETYYYRDGGTRSRKISITNTSGGAQTHATTYAGGSEIRQRRLNSTLQLDIVVTDAGGVRLVENRLTGEVHLRYSFSDHLNSSGGETDEAGSVTSREEYYPYGGSAGADEEAEEIHDRTRRYSGKERDATGLLYYGWRYYMPESGRWLSADPGGLIDGLNLFRFCRNNPVNIIDTNGLGCIHSTLGSEQETRHDNTPAASSTSFGITHTPKLGPDVLVVNNLDMEFGALYESGDAGGQNSYVYMSRHKPSNTKYITKAMFSAGYAQGYLSAKNEVFAYIVSEKLQLGLVPHTAYMQKNNKVITIKQNGYQAKKEVPHLPHGYGNINEYIISEFIKTSNTQKKIGEQEVNRRKTILAVFDYLIGQRDRQDGTRNVVFDGRNNLYAIDNSIILDDRVVEPADEQVSQFMSNTDTVDAMRKTDWSSLFDQHYSEVLEKYPLYKKSEHNERKIAFLNRVARVQAIFDNK